VKIIKPSVELIWMTPNPEFMIEMATRTAYKSEDSYEASKSAGFLDRIINQNHHHSVVEHASASFRVICDRAVANEIVRHRVGMSYTQSSTRYCNYSKDKFDNGINVTPMLKGLNEHQIDRRLELYNLIEAIYLAEIAEGIAPQQARDNLPLCLQTEIVITGTFRALLHFIELRSAKSAHPQIRPIAYKINNLLSEQAPNVFKHLEIPTGVEVL
jgi:thymidylate synthase (FAD)